jgi:putative transposase
VNWKKLYRIYREERLTVRKRGGRKRALGTRAPMAIPQGPNQRWSLDFVSDSLAGVDGSGSCASSTTSAGSAWDLSSTPRSPAIRVARELDRIAELRGYPCMVVSDNGTELTSNAILNGSRTGSVEWHYIAPGKADAERLRRKLQRPLRDECLNEHLFSSLRHARHLIAAWRDDYNHHRPHTSLDGLTQLDRTQVPCLLVDLRHLGPAHGMGAIRARLETERRDPATNDPRILPGRQVRAAVEPAGPQEL